MASPTPVNDQITDAEASAHFTALASAPAFATATALIAMAHATGLAMLSAASASQNWNTGHQAATLIGASKILDAGTDDGSSFPIHPSGGPTTKAGPKKEGR